MIRWQRTGFKLFWAWKSRRNGPGRPAVAPEIRALIRRMSKANPLWGAPRIHGELQKLGLEISQAAVSKYVVRHRRPPSQTWRTFLGNHLGNLVSVDFFVVPTVLFKVLFVFVVLAHAPMEAQGGYDRRESRQLKDGQAGQPPGPPWATLYQRSRCGGPDRLQRVVELQLLGSTPGPLIRTFTDV